MRSHLLTKSLFCSFLCFALPNLNGVAVAQVYKSYDDNGNVVFSDKPTKRSKEVELGKPNLIDAVKIPPPPPAPADPAPETRPAAQPEPEPVTQPIADGDYIDTNNDGRISRREKDDQLKERRKQKREKEKAAAGNSE